jgi:hypothetical protein
LADQLRKRGTDKQIETLGFFLTGEAKLEQVPLLQLTKHDQNLKEMF